MTKSPGGAGCVPGGTCPTPSASTAPLLWRLPRTTTSIPLVTMLHDASGGGPALTPPGQSSRFVQNEGPVTLVSLAGEDGDCADGSDDGSRGLLESLHAVVTHAAIATALMNFHFMIVWSPDTGAGHFSAW